MRLAHYPVKFDESFTNFEFVSEGPRGRIRKSVQFAPIGTNLYNLAMGNIDLVTGQLDDLVVTDNGDREKVLATVVEIVYAFCERYPFATIVAAGSTPARTRLYRMGIRKNYVAATANFFILGQKHNENWEPLSKRR